MSARKKHGAKERGASSAQTQLNKTKGYTSTYSYMQNEIEKTLDNSCPCLNPLVETHSSSMRRLRWAFLVVNMTTSGMICNPETEGTPVRSFFPWFEVSESTSRWNL